MLSVSSHVSSQGQVFFNNRQRFLVYKELEFKSEKKNPDKNYFMKKTQ